MPRVLVLEPFCGGSHGYFIELLRSVLQTNGDFYTLPAKKWHWRSRVSALQMAEMIPRKHSYRLLLSSSILNLAELVALRPDLKSLHKILYFHENQLVYPVRHEKESDYQFGYNQIISCLVADQVVFNSRFNQTSFVERIKIFLNKIPGYRPNDATVSCIAEKCSVLYFPIAFPDRVSAACSDEISRSESLLHIVWPHRWEHDKNPDLLFKVLLQLQDDGFQFQISILGERYQEIPPCFHEAKSKLRERIRHWGFLPSKEDYFNVLRSAHVVISTAEHEFFGVSMLEAAHLGCFPLCPNRLVYPEIFPETCLYRTEKQLAKMLRGFCKHPNLAVEKRAKLDLNFDRYSWNTLQSSYLRLLQCDGPDLPTI